METMPSTSLIDMVNVAAKERRSSGEGDDDGSSSSDSDGSTSSSSTSSTPTPSSPVPNPAMTTSSGPGTLNSNIAAVPSLDALETIKLHEERTIQRIAHLESIIADATLGIVSRTRAKVELALLKSDNLDNDDADGAERRRRKENELAAIKSGHVCAGGLLALEQGALRSAGRLATDVAIREHMAEVHALALRRTEERRERCAAADKEVKEAEMEAEAAVALAKAAMAKLDEARQKAKEERNLFEEARKDEKCQLQELERLKISNKTDNREEAQAEEDENIEGSDETHQNTFESELQSMKADLANEQRDVQYWSAECSRLTQKVSELEAEVDELRSTTKHQESKIASLEEHMEEHGVGMHSYWEDRTSKLGDELEEMHQKHEAQELELDDLKAKLQVEDAQVSNLRTEIQELEAMKKLLESKLASQEVKERDDYETLVDEVTKLITQKADALETVTQVKQFHEKSMDDRWKLISALQTDMDVSEEGLKQAMEALTDNELQAAAELHSLRADTSKKQSMLLEDQEQVVRELEEELGRSVREIARLEEINERQTKTIGKMERRAKKDGSFKEAFVRSDNEIRRLSSSLTMEAEKAGRLTVDVTHWKESASDLSKTVCVLESQKDDLRRAMEEMEGRLTRKTAKLQDQMDEMKKKNGNSLKDQVEEFRKNNRAGDGNGIVRVVVGGSSASGCRRHSTEELGRRYGTADKLESLAESPSENDASPSPAASPPRTKKASGKSKKGSPKRRNAKELARLKGTMSKLESMIAANEAASSSSAAVSPAASTEEASSSPGMESESPTSVSSKHVSWDLPGGGMREALSTEVDLWGRGTSKPLVTLPDLDRD